MLPFGKKAWRAKSALTDPLTLRLSVVEAFLDGVEVGVEGVDGARDAHAQTASHQGHRHQHLLAGLHGNYFLALADGLGVKGRVV